MSLGFALRYTKKGENANLDQILTYLIRLLSDWKHKTPILDRASIRNPDFFDKRLMFDYVGGDSLLEEYQELQKKLKQEGGRSYVLAKLSATSSASATGTYCNPILLAQGVMRVPMLLGEMAKVRKNYGDPRINKPLKELLEHLKENEYSFKQEFSKASSMIIGEIPSKLYNCAKTWANEFNSEVGGGLQNIIDDITVLKKSELKTVKTVASPTPKFSSNQLSIIQKANAELSEFNDISLDNSGYFNKKSDIYVSISNYRSKIGAITMDNVSKILSSGFASYKALINEIIHAANNSSISDAVKGKFRSEKDFQKVKKALIKSCNDSLSNMKKYARKWDDVSKSQSKQGGVLHRVSRRLSQLVK